MDLNDPKGILIGSMDFDNPKVYDDTFISDGLVFSLKMVQKRLKCFTMVPVGLEGERRGSKTVWEMAK